MIFILHLRFELHTAHYKCRLLTYLLTLFHIHTVDLVFGCLSMCRRHLLYALEIIIYSFHPLFWLLLSSEEYSNITLRRNWSLFLYMLYLYFCLYILYMIC